jgi:hypothetical protein
MARQTYLDAVLAGHFAGRLAPGSLREAAQWDDESYDVLSARHIEIGREAGALAVLPTALTTRIVACVFAGQLAAAEELIEEMRALTAAMGLPRRRTVPCSSPPGGAGRRRPWP